MTKENIQIEIASIDDANKILEIQKEAFLDQARIYNNYQLPPLTQSLDSIENEFNEKTFLKVMLKSQIIASVRFSVIDGCVIVDTPSLVLNCPLKSAVHKLLGQFAIVVGLPGCERLSFLLFFSMQPWRFKIS